MGFRLHRSLKLFPGLRLNFSKSGLGLSAGIPGAHLSMNPKRGMRTTTGIPGTGLSYSQKVGGAAKHQASPQPQAAPDGPVLTCPHCHQQNTAPQDCDPNTTLSCAHCGQKFTPPPSLFVDDEDDVPAPEVEGPAPRHVHLVLHSPIEDKNLADKDPTDSSLEEHLESLRIGDGSRLTLIAKHGFVQAFRPGEDVFRVEWRTANGQNYYAGEQPQSAVVSVFQDFAAGEDLTNKASWRQFEG